MPWALVPVVTVPGGATWSFGTVYAEHTRAAGPTGPTAPNHRTHLGRPAIEHDNIRVQRFLGSYLRAFELYEDHPQIDDILSGTLVLKTEGKSSTRTLSRSTLFHILQRCRNITVKAADEATTGQYAYSTLAEYAALARVASKAIEGYLDTLPPRPKRTLQQCRRALDAPYRAELVAAGLV
jgi:hypothetical protein